MTELSELRRRLTIAEFRAGLLEHGIDPVYVSGLLSDWSIVDKLGISSDGRANAEIADVVRLVVAELPRNAYRLRLTESTDQWLERISNGGRLEDYTQKASAKCEGITTSE